MARLVTILVVLCICRATELLAQDDCPDASTVQRILLLDAGSTKTRLYLFTVTKTDEEVTMTSKSITKLLALSNIKSTAGFTTLRSQFQEALNKVADSDIPAGCRSTTIPALFATAGLRLVGETLRNQILTEVKSILSQSEYKKRVMADNFRMLTGQEEGAFLWVAGNFLNGKMTQAKYDENETVAMLDLGGGSTQVVCTKAQIDSSLVASLNSSNIYTGNLMGVEVELYAVSYLGGGRNAMRYRMSTKMNTIHLRSKCIQEGLTMDDSFYGLKVNYLGQPVEDRGDVCKELALSAMQELNVEKLWTNDAQLPTTIGVASYYYIGHSVYQLNEQCGIVSNDGTPIGTTCDLKEHEFTLKQFKAAAETYCMDPPDDLKIPMFAGFMCSDLQYLGALLGEGYGLQEDHPISLRQKKDDLSYDWTVGKALDLGFKSLTSATT